MSQHHTRVIKIYNDSIRSCDDTTVLQIKSDAEIEVTTGDAEIWVSFRLGDNKWIIEVNSEIRNTPEVDRD